jgi:hypothetical protein
VLPEIISPRAHPNSSTQGHRRELVKTLAPKATASSSKTGAPTVVGPSSPTRCVARDRPIAASLRSSKTDAPTVAGPSSPAANPSSPCRHRPELAPSPPACARPRPMPPPPPARAHPAAADPISPHRCRPELTPSPTGLHSSWTAAGRSSPFFGRPLEMDV